MRIRVSIYRAPITGLRGHGCGWCLVVAAPADRSARFSLTTIYSSAPLSCCAARPVGIALMSFSSIAFRGMNILQTGEHYYTNITYIFVNRYTNVILMLFRV